jgi:hypothetical protein
MTAALSATAIVAVVAEHAARRIIRRTIRDLQRMPSDLSSGDSAEQALIPVATDDIAAHLLRDYIYRAAADWSNARIRAYLDR